MKRIKMFTKREYLSLIESFAPRYKSFMNAIRTPDEIQKHILLRIINENQSTLFGKEHNFRGIKGLQDYKKKVPIRDYEDFSKYIIQIIDGCESVLTKEKVISLQPTSGSISPTKFIPLTATLKKEFQEGVFTWLYDLISNRPKLQEGRFYWAITPPKRLDITSKTSIGFAEDLDYFNEDNAQHLERLSCVPFDVSKSNSLEECRKRTLKHLVDSPDLTFISVWHPSFLTTLLDLDKNLSPKDKWKNLTLISCWLDGNSGIYADRIKEIFPNTEIQGKGLMSTEAFTTLPFSNTQEPVLSINSHFFEFQDLNSQEILLPSELKKGINYEEIITTGGGLYRYSTGDVVEVTGKYLGCPTMRFIGRKNNISDYVGEKLNELHVSKILLEQLKNFDIAPEFVMVSPEKEEDKIRYYLHLKTRKDFKELTKLRTNLENGLRENYHYDYAFRLGQISPLEINLLKIDNPNERFVSVEESRGKRVGSIKQPLLNKSLGWKEMLK